MGILGERISAPEMSLREDPDVAGEGRTGPRKKDLKFKISQRRRFAFQLIRLENAIRLLPSPRGGHVIQEFGKSARKCWAILSKWIGATLPGNIADSLRHFSLHNIINWIERGKKLNRHNICVSIKIPKTKEPFKSTNLIKFRLYYQISSFSLIIEH